MVDLVIEVVAMKAFKGVIDGEIIDSGKLFGRIKLNERNNREGENFAKGEITEEWRCPDAETVFRLKHLTVPFTARMEIERVSNGKESKEIVIAVNPVETVKAAPLAVNDAAVIRKAA